MRNGKRGEGGGTTSNKEGEEEGTTEEKSRISPGRRSE